MIDRLREKLTAVYPQKKCLGSPDMKQKNVRDFLDVLMLLFVENY